MEPLKIPTLFIEISHLSAIYQILLLHHSSDCFLLPHNNRKYPMLKKGPNYEAAVTGMILLYLT